VLIPGAEIGTFEVANELIIEVDFGPGVFIVAGRATDRAVLEVLLYWSNNDAGNEGESACS